MKKEKKTKTKSSVSSVKESTTKKETAKDVSTEDVSPGDVPTEQKPVKPYPEPEDSIPGSLELESTIKNLIKKNEELEKALAHYKDKEKQERSKSVTSEQEHPLVTERRLKQQERFDKAKIKQAIDILSSVISK